MFYTAGCITLQCRKVKNVKVFATLSLLSTLLPSLLFGAEFEDALGRQLSFDQPPQRIISLVPAVTEILFALGLQDRLVAVTDYCDYPPAAKELPQVGLYSRPSLESILLFKPDLVIASAGMNRPSLVKRLEGLNIPVYVVNPHNIAESIETIRNLGSLNGRSMEAEDIVTAMQARIDRLEEQLSVERKPQILTLIMLQPLTVAGPDTFIDDIIKRSGGENVVPAGPSRYPTWNSEALLAIDPEVIVVSSHPGQPDPQSFFEQWPQLQAVRNKRVVEIEADWLHRPGPRIVLGIEAMTKVLHPGINLEN